MAVAWEWSTVDFPLNGSLEETMKCDMPDRKNKNGAEKRIPRRVPRDFISSELKPVALLAAVRRIGKQLARRRPLLPPIALWQLPMEGFPPLGMTDS